MPITMGDSFNINMEKPLDCRTYFTTVKEMKDFSINKTTVIGSTYIFPITTGTIAFCLEKFKYYYMNARKADGSITMDIDTAKETELGYWKELPLGGTGVEIYEKYSELPRSFDKDTIVYVKNNEIITQKIEIENPSQDPTEEEPSTSEQYEDIEYKAGFYFYSVSLNSYTYISGGGSSISNIKVNNVTLTPDENGDIDITVPTKLDELENDPDTGFVKKTDIASTTEVGVIMIDGTSIIIKDGVISATSKIDDENITTTSTYSSKKIDDDFAKNSNVLQLDNVTVYTPTGDYHPATKKYVDDALDALSFMSIKGRVNTFDDLPTTDTNQGDTWYVGEENIETYDIYIKLEDGNWLKIGNTNIKLTDYYKKTEIDALLTQKISVSNTLPTAVVELLGEIYFQITDNCIYHCISKAPENEGDPETYEWEKLNLDSPIYKGNVTPSDTTKIWLDDSNSENILIKVYDEVKGEWITINSSSSEYIESITYTNGVLSVKAHNKDTVKYIMAGGGSIKKSLINGNLTVDNEEIQVYDDTDTMKKSDYASEVNEGNVKVSDYTEAVKEVADNSEPNVYYGHNSEGITGLYPFPIGTQDESKLITKEYLNVTEGWEKIITESLIPLNDKVMISVLKTISNPTDIDVTIKEFNLENEITINHSDKVSIKDNQISIQNEFVGDNLTNSDGLLETDLSSYTQINRCEVK